MTIATDRVEILLDFIGTGIPLAIIPGLKVFCLEADWNKLPQISRRAMTTLRQKNIIRFIDLDSIFYSDIVALFQKYGAGIAMSNYYILSYCQINNIPLLTRDSTISRVARGERLKMRKAKSFHLELMVKAVGLQGPERVKEALRYERKKEYDVEKKRGDQLAS